MSRKYTNHDEIEIGIHEQKFYPIVKLEYPLTFRTVMRAGVQGFRD